MKPFAALAIAILALCTTGCTNDQTSSMAKACQNLLGQNTTGVQSFIEKAEERVESLGKPQGKLTAYLRDLQDPDAMQHKVELEHCVWQLKLRQG